MLRHYTNILPEGTNLNAAQLEAIQAGVQDSMMGGPIAGSPLVDVHVSLDTVEVFDKDSTPQALRIAATQSVRNAIRNAGGVKMQPIMKSKSVKYVGSVLGDLNPSKR